MPAPVTFTTTGDDSPSFGFICCSGCRSLLRWDYATFSVKDYGLPAQQLSHRCPLCGWVSVEPEVRIIRAATIAAVFQSAANLSDWTAGEATTQGGTPA